jgi:isocitrate dehydrogenase (NAD+)
MVDGAEAVGDAMLATVANQQDVCVRELRVAVGARRHRLIERRWLGHLTRIPVRALDRPGDDVLEAAEDGSLLPGRLVRVESVAGLHVGSTPGALLQIHMGRVASMALRIVVLEGDQTGQELLDQALRVIAPAVIGLEVELERFDLSLENRRETKNAVCTEAAGAMAEAGFGIKAATITPEGADDVGSPNRLIREAIDGKVIVRTGRRIPGVSPVAGIHHPISVVRMAVEDAYGAEESRRDEDGDEVAQRIEVIHRSNCRAVAEYAFRTAEEIGGRVYGGPKWTVSPVYEGMLKEEMDGAAERHPEVAYEPLLIDATYAGLLTGRADAPLVIPSLNRDGDLLSDLVLPLYGSIAGAESVLLALDDELQVRVAMSEAPHGTAPALEGKDIANPMGMILAAAAVLHYAGVAGVDDAERASRAVYDAVLETAGAGTRTPDLKGHASTTEFTDAVIERLR